jgi:hypothetical protein
MEDGAGAAAAPSADHLRGFAGGGGWKGGAVRPSDVCTDGAVKLFSKHALPGARRLEGMLMDSSPAGRSRAVDHLNRAGRFVRLWAAEEHYLINKGQIVHVGELVWTPE